MVDLAFPPLRMTAVIAGYADTNAVSLEMFFRFKFIFKLCHFKLGGSFHVMSTPMLFQVRWFFSSYVDANVISSCVVSVLLLCWLCVMSTQMLFQVVRCGEFHVIFQVMWIHMLFQALWVHIRFQVVSIENSISSCVDSNVISSCVETNVISSCADTNVVSNLLTQVSIANSCYVDAHVNKLLSC